MVPKNVVFKIYLCPIFLFGQNVGSNFVRLKFVGPLFFGEQSYPKKYCISIFGGETSFVGQTNVWSKTFKKKCCFQKKIVRLYFWLKKRLVTKFWITKNCQSKKSWVPEKCCVQLFFFVKKNLWLNKLLGKLHVRFPKILGQNKLWVNKNIEKKICLKIIKFFSTVQIWVQINDHPMNDLSL